MGKKKTLPTLRIIIVGSSGVGKYSLAHQFAKGWISPRDANATGDTETNKQMQIQGVKYEVKVYAYKDVAQADISGMKPCDGAVMVYSVVDKKSLTYLKTVAFQKLHEGLKDPDKSDGNGTDANQKQHEEGSEKEIAETPTGQPDNVGLNVPVILVGNKVDDAKLSRAVEIEEGEALSKELCCSGFFETAATCNANVPKAFEALLDQAIANKSSREDGGDKPIKPTKACCIVQ